MKIRKKYSNEIANIVKTNLANFGWQCSFEEDYGLFIFDLKVNSNIKSIRSFFRITESALVFYGISPIQANTKDPEIMKELGEFFCRANFGLDIG